MERSGDWLKGLTVVLIFIISVFDNLNASGNGSEISYYRAIIYQSYIRNDMTRWKNILDSMEQLPRIDDALRLELVNYLYGYIGWCMGQDRKEEARRYLKRADAQLALLKPNRQYEAYIQAYESAFYGYEIGLNLWKGPVLGPRSVEMAKEAIRLDPQNPIGYIQYANSLYYRPAILGGSKSEALELYLQALVRMEARINGDHKNWNYLNLLVLIAQAYEELGRREEAGKVYKKILSVEPDFDWVKNELYPKYLQRRKK